MSEERAKYGVDGVIDLMNRVRMGLPMNEAEDMRTQKQKLLDKCFTETDADLADALLDLYWSARMNGDVGPASNAFAKAHNVLREYGLLGGDR